MTPTIKENLEITIPGKPGSPSQSSDNRSGESPRSNPVCLEVPVTVRSLPGENGNAFGAAGPSREEGRTVIVFDNGAVLRLSNNLTPGQSIILSNAQGRDVVCRVSSGRNLPTIKGYIEVQFIEPVNDFWRIHQTGEPANVPPPPIPVLAVPQPVPVVQAVPPSAPSVVAPEKEETNSLGSAPTFEDIAGLVGMSPATASRIKTNEPAGQIGSVKSKDESTRGQIEPVKPAPATSALDPVSEVPSKNPAIPPAREFSSLPASRPSSSNEIFGRTMTPAGQPSSAPTSARTRGPMPLILGGAALVLAGFGAAYFFMHQGTPASPAASTTAQQSASAPPVTSSVAGPAQISPPAVEEPPAQPQPDSTTPAASSAAIIATPESDNAKRPGDNADGKQPDRASKQRPQIPSLKMKSPSAPRANSAKLDVSTPSLTDVSSAAAIGGAPTTGMLPSVVRSESQPAPPSSSFSSGSSPLSPSASPAKSVREAKLLSSVRPVYPPLAKQSNTQGAVVVFADVDAKGNVIGVKAVSGPMFLRQAAIDAVRRWKYSPALIDGKPAASQVTVSVDFHLN